MTLCGIMPILTFFHTKGKPGKGFLPIVHSGFTAFGYHEKERGSFDDARFCWGPARPAGIDRNPGMLYYKV